MKSSSNLNISCKVVFSLNKWNKKVGSPSSFGRKRPFISLNSSASIEDLSSSERARACARANHAKNDAQKGCAMQLNGITLNVRGISNFKKRRTIFTWCRRKNADAIFLQETHLVLASEKQWKNECNGVVKCFFHMVVPTHVGPQLPYALISNKANLTELSTTADPLGRFIISKVQVDDKVYVLVNTYAPNKDKDSTFF